MEKPGFRTIQTGRRYVLGEGEDFYGVWDQGSPGRPVESFTLTDAGLQEATKRFAQLSRQDFWARFGPRALRWALFGGLGVWILSGLVVWIRNSFSFPELGIPIGTPAPFFPGEPVWVRVTQLAEATAFRAWVAALAIIFALRLFDRGRQPT